MADTQKAIVFSSCRHVDIMEVPIPEVGEEDVLVKTKISSISPGTEMAVYRGAPYMKNMRGVKYSFPLIPGYDITGEVIEIGENVKGYSIGDRVFVGSTPNVYGEIDSMWGGHVEFALSNYKDINKIPDNVSYEEATFLGVIQAAMNGVIVSDIKLGSNVVVLGQGLVGLYSAELAICSGAKEVVVIDKEDNRLKFSRMNNLCHAFNSKNKNLLEKIREITLGEGADVVLDCIGLVESFPLAFKIVNEIGIVTMTGAYWNEQPNLPFDLMSSKQVEVRIAGVSPIRFRNDLPRRYKFWQYSTVNELCLKLISDNRLSPRKYITDCFNYKEAKNAYLKLDADAATLGVVFKWE